MVALAQGPLALPATAAMNKCVDSSGKVTYQSEPCPQGAVQQTIKPGASSPSAAEPKAGDSSHDEAIMRLVAVRAAYEGCSKRSGGLGAEADRRYAVWRAKNAVDLRRYETSPRFTHLMEVAQRTFGDPGPEYCRDLPDMLAK